MTGLEIIAKYPLSIAVVKDYFFRKLKESCEGANIPEEFKEYLLVSGVEYSQIEAIIQENPRFLFDVFDENDLCIQITGEGSSWFWGYKDNMQNNEKNSRKAAEKEAIESVFETLENKLNSL